MDRSWVTQQAYYQGSAVAVRMPGGRVTAYRRTAMGGAQEFAVASWLLARWAQLPQAARVLLLGAGDGRVAAALGGERGDLHWTLTDPHAAAVACAERTCRAAAVADVRVLGAEGAPPEDEGTFDIVLAMQPKSRAAWERVVLAGGVALRAGGAMYLAGANHSGIRTAAKYLGEQFGGVEVVGYRGGCRCVRADRPAEWTPPAEWANPWREGHASVAGMDLTWQTRPGVFSLGGLDAGTRRLIECVAAEQVKAGPSVLDLGCGCGVAALAAGRVWPGAKLTAVDVDCRAVSAATRTLADAGLTGARVLAGDCVEPVANETFDVILTNPPLHHGKGAAINVAEQFLRDAAVVLAEDSVLLAVANAHLRYDRVLRACFRDVNVAGEDRHFRVWRATGPTRTGASTAPPDSRPRREG